jgi:hypothetical protein
MLSMTARSISSRNRATVRVAGMVAAVLTVTACGTKDAAAPLSPSGPVGRVRIVNLITDTTRGRVNAILEGLPFAVNLTYAQSSPATLPAPSTAPYAAVLTGPRQFVLKRTADTNVTVATLPFTINEGQDVSVYATGGAGGSAVASFVTADTNPAVATTAMRVRVVNGSPTAGAVDVFITSPGAELTTAVPAVANLAYRGASAYLTPGPGTYQIRAVPAGTAPANRSAATTINLASAALAGGSTRTIVLADNTTGGAPLRAFVLTDR